MSSLNHCRPLVTYVCGTLVSHRQWPLGHKSRQWKMYVTFSSSSRDRDNMTKKLNEEHDQRRIEQMEVAFYFYL